MISTLVLTTALFEQIFASPRSASQQDNPSRDFAAGSHAWMPTADLASATRRWTNTYRVFPQAARDSRDSLKAGCWMRPRAQEPCLTHRRA